MERIPAPPATRSTAQKNAPRRPAPPSALTYPFTDMKQRLGNRNLARLLQAQFPMAGAKSRREMEAVAMPAATRGSAEGAARIHAGPEAAETADALGARAFTVGGDVVFNRGQYAPENKEGADLLSHEMAHVAQNQASASPGAALITRQPKPDTEDPAKAPGKDPGKTPALNQPPAQFQWRLSDLLMYPLLVDVWRDVIFKQLSSKDKSALKLKGTEGAAFYAWLDAALLSTAGTGGTTLKGSSFGTGLSTYQNYLKAIEPLTPAKDVVMDGISRIVGLRIDDYLASDLFLARLKAHALSALALFVIAQTGLSLYKGVISPPGSGTPSPSDIGTFGEDWTSHLALIRALTGAIFKEQLKAPSFFDISPLQLKTHPAFAYTPFEGEKPPEGITGEYDKGTGVGQGGRETKLGLTLNFTKLAAFGDNQRKADYLADLSKYRGWQASAWFSYDKVDPTAVMSAAGRIAEERLKGGAIFGNGGHLLLLETGARFSGGDADALTSWFIRGGYGYAGAKDSPLKRIGFDFIYRSANAADALAPGRETGTPTASQAAQLTPFLDLQFGARHKFGLRTSASLALTDRDAGLSALTAGLSYTYMGDRTKDQLPVFRIDISGSMHRLDWWNPQSPVMKGLQLKANYQQYFGGVEVMTGAAAIAPERAAQFDQQPGARNNTGTIFIVGRAF